MSAVLLFGGTFDPIHHGHLIVCRTVAERIGASRTILIPSANPPHKLSSAISPAGDRLQMCRAAVTADPEFEISDWEISRPGPNFTLHTVQHFRSVLPPDESLFWLIGMDSLAELATWHRVADLAAACTLVTAARPGHPRPHLRALRDLLVPAQLSRVEQFILDTPMIDIRATDIRSRVRAGRSVRYLVPDAVARYIEEHGLYATA